MSSKTLKEIIEEAIEDIALAQAIEEGEHSERVSRQKVFELLDASQEGVQR